MKILMIAPQCFFLPRGTPLSIFGRLRALSFQGHEVDLVTYPFGENVDLPGLSSYRVLRLPGIREIKVGPSWAKLFLDVLVFFKVLSLLRKKPYELIHSHEEGAFFGAPLARFFGLQHLYDMHSSLPQQLSNFGFYNFKPVVKIFCWLERWTIRLSDAVIAVCPELVHYANSIEPGKQTFLIENSDDISQLDANGKDIQALRKKYNLNGKKLVVYTGSFEPYQGLELLIESAGLVIKEMNQVLFLCIGGTKEQRERLQKLIKAKHLDSYIILPGTVPAEEVPAYLKIAHVLVSPRSKGTNTPLKIYSYLRAGRAIVATDLLTHRQVLNSGVAILTEPNPKAFAEGILKPLKDPRLCRKLGQQAKKLAETKYNHTTFLTRTHEVLASLIHPKEF